MNIQLGACAHGTTPSLNVVRLNFGYDTIELVIKQWLLSTIAFLSKEPFSDYQVNELVTVLLNKGGKIKLAEMAIFFNNLKSGDYGQIYGDLKPSDITVAFNTFMVKRVDIIDKWERDNDRIKRENSNDNGALIRAKISLATYEEFKRKNNEQLNNNEDEKR